VNTIPGFDDFDLPEDVGSIGSVLSRLLDRLIALALERHEETETPHEHHLT
jgi:hypothetical protein